MLRNRKQLLLRAKEVACFESSYNMKRRSVRRMSIRFTESVRSPSAQLMNAFKYVDLGGSALCMKKSPNLTVYRVPRYTSGSQAQRSWSSSFATTFMSRIGVSGIYLSDHCMILTTYMKGLKNMSLESDKQCGMSGGCTSTMRTFYEPEDTTVRTHPWIHSMLN
jgi:hypothetical protein